MKLTFQSEAGTISFVSDREAGLGIQEAGLLLEVDGIELSAAGAEVRGPTTDGVIEAGTEGTATCRWGVREVEWVVTLKLSKDGTTGYLSSAITNRSASEVRLGKCCLLSVDAGQGTVALGEERGDTVYLDCKASVHDTRVKQCSEDDGRHMVKTICHVFNRTSKHAINLSFVTFDRANTEHRFAYEAGKGIVELESCCDFDGFRLQPGASVESEVLTVELCSDPYRSLEAWADRVQAHYQPEIWPGTPAGWVGWSWVDPFNIERYEEVVLRNARAIRDRLAGFGLEFIWVSIGNLKDGMPGNWLEVDGGNFPSGVAKVVDELRGCGIKLGFWMAPFWICSYVTDKVEELEECLLRDESGELLVTRAEWQYGAAGSLPKEQRPSCYALDGSHPRTLEFLRNVFQTYYEWGIRYYMVDFLHAGSGSTPGDHLYGDYHDQSLIRGPEVYRNAMKVVREAAGPDTYLLSSTGVTFQNIGCVDAVRTGNDYGEGRALNPESYFYPATFVINSPSFWTSHLRAAANLASSYYTHRKLYLNDSGNVMTVDQPIPVCEAQITATIFGINGGPMMIGDDLDRIDDERLALIKKCLPRTPEIAFPVDLFDSVFPDHPKVFHLKVTREWDEWDLVAVLNLGDETLVQGIDLARIGLDPGADHVLWEFWNEQYLGTVAGSFEAVVPVRSARLYRLSVSRPHPWLLSTDMHTRQGQVEIDDCQWDSRTATLRVKAVRPGGERGSIFLRAPKGLCVRDPRELWIGKDAQDESLIVRKPLKFDGRPVEVWVQFAPIDSVLSQIQG